MNKKAIWTIIGLMSASLIGIGWMQVSWILDSLRLNEKSFNNHVIDAINDVADYIEDKEMLEAFDYNDNGYSRSFFEQNLMERVAKGEVPISLSIEKQHLNGLPSGDMKMSQKEMWNVVLDANVCDCSNCKEERYKSFTRWVSLHQGSPNVPIAERVQLNLLDKVLKQELRDHGVDLDYKYGVYSNRKKSFVVANGVYVVENNKTQPIQAGYKNLYNSKYRINLFQQEVPSPGMLMVYFPTKTSFLWASVWKNLLGTLIFTGIILFCFVYTIQVIIRQKKVSEMKNDFINNMTHEFKTPIATISLATDSITSPMISGNTEKVKRFANIIKQENKRMNNQVEKVLQMAMLGKKDFSLKYTDVNMNEVIARAVENISLSVEKKAGSVVADYQAEQPIFKGDLTHISNIINNLLDNANKYSPENPEISVHTRNVEGGLEVIIKDKGIGMSKEARKHIFDKFYRVHTGNLHDVKGFGLGLSYVKAMMDAHKGKIEVLSEPEKGSSFILTFPQER